MSSTSMPCLALQLVGGLQGAGNDGAVGDDGEVLAGAHDLGLAEGDGVIGAGIGAAAEGLAIEALVLEEEHGVVAADGGAQQAVGVERVRRE